MDLCSLYELCQFLRDRVHDTARSYGGYATHLNDDESLRNRTKELIRSLSRFDDSIRYIMKQIDDYTCQIPDSMYDYLASGQLDTVLLSSSSEVSSD